MLNEDFNDLIREGLGTIEASELEEANRRLRYVQNENEKLAVKYEVIKDLLQSTIKQLIEVRRDQDY